MIMITRASARYVRVPPRKAREVADLVRGQAVSRALAIMDYCPKKAALVIKKVLQSALANAKAREKVDVERLYVSAVAVDEGPVLKRFIPRAMGRATPIRKRMSHITIELDERPEDKESAAVKKKKKEKKNSKTSHKDTKTQR